MAGMRLFDAVLGWDGGIWMATGAATTPPDRFARGLLRCADRAVLATRLGPEGWPYASLVLLAVDHDAAPILLLSDLVEHRRGLAGGAGTGWRMTGIDPEGCDLGRAGATARVAFATPVDGPAAARAELVRLTRLARGNA